jgi:hypothetical protein
VNAHDPLGELSSERAQRWQTARRIGGIAGKDPESTRIGHGACHGFLVIAADGPCGSIETPLFPPDCNDPDFLVVRVGGRRGARRVMVPAGLVQHVDADAQTVRISGTRDELARLPEMLPLPW